VVSQELLGACWSSGDIQYAIRQPARRDPFLEQRRTRMLPIELIQKRQRERCFSRAQAAFDSRQ
jgi:hypothetical protein